MTEVNITVLCILIFLAAYTTLSFIVFGKQKLAVYFPYDYDKRGLDLSKPVTCYFPPKMGDIVVYDKSKQSYICVSP